MSHKIPEPYKWDESFATFYAQIDDEHKGLFDGIFAVAGAPSDGGALSALVGKVKAHFSYEEGVMQKKNYGEYPQHKKLHDDFVAKCGGIKTPVSGDNINFLKDWLVQHIKNTDFKYKGKLD